MRWLITGGCGFIGSNLIADLVADRTNFIRVVDDLSVGTRADLAAVSTYSETLIGQVRIPTDATGVELIVGNIVDSELATIAAHGFDVIVHLAANTGVGPSVENPRADMIANVIGTFNYLEAARKCGVPRFVFASSGAPIGECVPPIHEEMAPHPVSPYGASKLSGEAYCSAYFRTFGIETVGLRFGNVYGPRSGHKNSAVAKFIRNALHREVLEVYGNGSQTRDFVYVGDLVRAIRYASVVPEIGGELFQIATNAETTVSELMGTLIDVLTKNGVEEVEVRNTSKRLGDVTRNFSDTSKAARVLGWKSEVALKDGLDRTVRWFLGRN